MPTGLQLEAAAMDGWPLGGPDCAHQTTSRGAQRHRGWFVSILRKLFILCSLGRQRAPLVGVEELTEDCVVRMHRRCLRAGATAELAACL